MKKFICLLLICSLLMTCLPVLAQEGQPPEMPSGQPGEPPEGMGTPPDGFGGGPGGQGGPGGMPGGGSRFSGEYTAVQTLSSDTEISGEFGDMTFSNGIAMFTLKDGESITAEDLPAGVGYEVIEAAGPDYTAEITGDKGTIEAKTDAEAAFTNTFKEEQKAAPVSPAGTSAPDSKTQTGDPATMALVLLALVISGSLMALMAKRSRQH